MITLAMAKNAFLQCSEKVLYIESYKLCESQPAFKFVLPLL